MPKEIKEIKDFLAKARKDSNVFELLMTRFALNPNSKKPTKKGRPQRKCSRQVHLEKEVQDLLKISSTDQVIRKLRVRPIVDLFRGYLTDMMVDKKELDILQEVAKEHLVTLFTDPNRMSTRSGRVTIDKLGFKLVMDYIRN